MFARIKSLLQDLLDFDFTVAPFTVADLVDVPHVRVEPLIENNEDCHDVSTQRHTRTLDLPATDYHVSGVAFESKENENVYDHFYELSGSIIEQFVDDFCCEYCEDEDDGQDFDEDACDCPNKEELFEFASETATSLQDRWTNNGDIQNFDDLITEEFTQLLNDGCGFDNNAEVILKAICYQVQREQEVVAYRLAQQQLADAEIVRLANRSNEEILVDEHAGHAVYHHLLGDVELTEKQGALVETITQRLKADTNLTQAQQKQIARATTLTELQLDYEHASKNTSFCHSRNFMPNRRKSFVIAATLCLAFPTNYFKSES